ncbi:MAG: PEP-CTERM sorting domain-containing protein [Phycisphaerales bacterium]|nr:PEP-CTERM sorting domain-containing protein [Phycisphaerales bacterium]
MRRLSMYAVCGAAILALTQCANAATIGFQVNPAQSHFSLSGVFRNTITGAIYPIPSGSGLNATYHGTILTDNDFSTLLFLGGAIDANPSGMYAPGPAEGDYGLSASLPSPDGSVVAAIRNFAISLTGAADPLSSGYDLSTVNATVTSGMLQSTKFADMSLIGAPAVLVAGTGTLFQTSTQKKLSLPLAMAFEEDIPGTNYSLEVTFSGMVVATRTVPEPASLLLLGVGAALVGRRRYC